MTAGPRLSPELTAAIERALGPLEGAPAPLDGGITNHNLRVRLGGGDYVVRLCGRETEVLGIDRQAEVQATRAAHALGLAPELVLFLPEHGCLVTRFAAGPAAEPGDVRRPEVLAGVARHLRAFHGGPALPVRFDVIALGERHRELVRARGGTVPPAYDEAARLAARIAATLGGAEHALVPCHNDLLPSNFILPAGGPITIVDWEYAGMNDRYFDLGNLAVNNELSPADEQLLLEAYWEEPASERRLATLSLMRIFSDYREASWGLAQTVLSELDFDFPAYADKHLARMLDAAAGPDLEGWLRAATA